MCENDFKLKSGMCTLIKSELFDLELYTEEQRGTSKTNGLCCKHYEKHCRVSLSSIQVLANLKSLIFSS